MGGRQLASSSVTHQPWQEHNEYNGEYSNINTILKDTGSLDYSPVTFPGAAMYVIRLSTLTSKYRNNISSAGFSAPIGANGSPLDVVGQIRMPVSIGNFNIEQVFVVVNTFAVDCLLGTDNLVAHGVIIDYKCSFVVIQDNDVPFTLKGCIATTLDASTCNKVILFLIQ